MPKGHDHQVPAGVRVQVEDDKGPLPAERDQVLRAVGQGLRIAEHTAVDLVVLVHIFHSPG